MSRAPRFEVVHSDAGWFARFVAANGRIVWVTESYKRRGKAERAVELICGEQIVHPTHGDSREIDWQGDMWCRTEVRDVDERAQVRAGVEVAG